MCYFIKFFKQEFQLVNSFIFPLAASKGLYITLAKVITHFLNVLIRINFAHLHLKMEQLKRRVAHQEKLILGLKIVLPCLTGRVNME